MGRQPKNVALKKAQQKLEKTIESGSKITAVFRLHNTVFNVPATIIGINKKTFRAQLLQPAKHQNSILLPEGYVVLIPKTSSTTWRENNRLLPYKLNDGGEVIKLNNGCFVKNLKDGNILVGPDHEHGGIEITDATKKPIAEAMGGEVVINAKSSAKHCEILSQINEDCGGIPLDCKNIENKTINALNEGGITSNYTNMKLTYKQAQQQLLELEKQAINKPTPELEKQIESMHDYIQGIVLQTAIYWDELTPEQRHNFLQNHCTDCINFENANFSQLPHKVKMLVRQHLELPLHEKGGRVWTEEQQQAVARLDAEHNAELKENNINPHSIEASKLWRSSGRKEKMQQIFKKDELPLFRSGGYLYSGSDVSKAIKQELKKIYPNIKFSVRYKSYAGGDSINVSWNFGPTTKQVESIINKYQEGSFDGMTDSYIMDTERPTYVTETGKIKELGGVKYVFADRHYLIKDGRTGNEQWDAEESIQLLMAKDLAKKYNATWIGHYTEIPCRNKDLFKDLAYRILVQCEFDTDVITSYNGLQGTGVSAGKSEEFYTVIYNGNKIAINHNAQDSIKQIEIYEQASIERELEQEKWQEKYDQEQKKFIEWYNSFVPKAYKTIKPVILQNVYWPSPNKLSTLLEYKEYYLENKNALKNNITKVKVEQVIIVNNNDWLIITENLLENMPKLWKAIGGAEITDDIAEKYNFPTDFSKFTELHKKIWHDNMYLLCTLLYNEDTSESIAIDTQWYEYARYVGIPENKKEIIEAMLLIEAPKYNFGGSLLNNNDKCPTCMESGGILTPNSFVTYKNSLYRITDTSTEGIFLTEVPEFRSQTPQNIFVYYDEFIEKYTEGKFIVQDIEPEQLNQMKTIIENTKLKAENSVLQERINKLEESKQSRKSLQKTLKAELEQNAQKKLALQAQAKARMRERNG